MNNNKIGNIAIKTSSRPRARFNLAHDVNTTFSFGDVQPAMCRCLPANSKTSVEVESLVRLAPLLSPTFGRIKYKQYHHFVGMSTLTENFSPMMAQQDVARGGRVFTPTDLPFCNLGLLSRYVLAGAKCTIYDGANGGDDSGAQISASLFHISDVNNVPSRVSTILTASQFTGAYDASGAIVPFDNYSGPTFDLDYVFGDGMHLVLPIANQTGWSFFDVLPSALNNIALQHFSGDVTTVPLDSADYVVTRSNGVGNNRTFAFRLSSFGKRLRKALIGCGYQVDFRSQRNVSLMPLFAIFKAYFDSFGLTLYSKWETSNAYQILRYTDTNYASANLDNWVQSGVPSYVSLHDIFLGFMNDIGNMWYTDSQDFVSAHTVNTAVSPNPSSMNPRLISVDTANGFHPNVDYSDISSVLGSLSNPNGHAYIDAIKHGYLDSEYLKILYHSTNKNTIAGQRIAELLRAAGLGKYVDEDKSNFIGENETIVTISDVTSTSDTYQDNGGVKSGQVLGDYAGKGVEYNRSKNFTFENDEVGFWVTLVCIIPESGYCQALDRSVTMRNKFDFYQPDFDALGFEATAKDMVVGSQDWSSPGGGSLFSSFGFIPTYSGMKIANNVMNGDFSLRGTRSSYQPFTLDKLINVGERDVFHDASGDTSDSSFYRCYKLLTASDLPTASPIWRFVGRYPWLGLFNRIFNQVGTQLEDDPRYYWYTGTGYSRFEYTYNDYDNFLCHNIFNVQQWAPMLPIEKSFETYEEGEEAPNSSMGKA